MTEVLLDRALEGGRGVVLLLGDACDLDLPENSVDSLVFDPPAAISFMGQGWDDDRGGFDEWTSWLATQLWPAYRALKPGGYGFAWALPRTSHWAARAIELAGFEIRDLHHELLDADEIARTFLESLDHAQRVGFARVLEAIAPSIYYQIFGQGFPKSLTSNSAPIPEWAGTALKPAVEHWIMFRKPLEGTVAQNYAKHGTGLLRIADCRVGTDDTRGKSSATFLGVMNDDAFKPDAGRVAGSECGRWPAHLSMDAAGAAELDAQSGGRAGSHGGDVRPDHAAIGYKRDGMGSARKVAKSTGGASRFFYVAKPARSEKDAGLGHLEPTTGGEATGRADGSAGTKNPRAGAGRTGGARNAHPTVKSVELMRWLVRLVTPAGGVVLDPFAGSGTTGAAAIAEGCSFVGVEQGGPCAKCNEPQHDDDADHDFHPKYVPILVGRIEHAIKEQEDK